METENESELHARAQELHREMLEEVLTHLFREWLDGNSNSPNYLRLVALKMIGQLWAIRPDLFGGASLSALAKAAGVNCHKSTLSTHAVKFADKYGVRNRGMQTGEARHRYQKAALRRKSKESF